MKCLYVQLRSESTDAPRGRIEGLLPGRAGTVGRPARDNRRFVNGVLWVLRSGMRWGDLPERYGKYKSAPKRFVRWARAGVWDRVFADWVKDRKTPHLRIDSTIVRAHQQAAAKKGLRKPGFGAKPRRTEHQDSPADRRLRPAAGLSPGLTPGQAAEQPQALPLLEGRAAEPSSPTAATTPAPSSRVSGRWERRS